jgi:putative hydrolase of the HAD superfamily
LSEAAALVVLDADDTLWRLEPLYDDARQGARAVVEEAGWDGSRWEAMERKIDVANVDFYGLSRKRFPTSCVEAYRRLAAESGAEAEEAVERDVRSASRTVFRRAAPLVAGAEAALKALRGVASVALLTKGDEVLQRRRLKLSGLADYFDEVRIVGHKDEAAFEAVLTRFGCPPARAWSIGNSLRSDVVPAVRLGMHAVWVDAHVWEYERAAEGALPAGVEAAGSLLEASLRVQAALGHRQRSRVAS